ncbi:MAG: UPF0175 family protein [Mucilaginibacter sp.]|nr:UPF0175 family protein [Mucilaginibacter sp.]
MPIITLNIPDSAKLNEKEAAIFMAANLYEKGKLSLGQAAEVAGLTKRTFAELLGTYGVSIFNYPASEIADDVNNSTKNDNNLEIGFWHPFGPHGGETLEDIINRKAAEIEKNGWTLWSFQNREKTHQLWTDRISEHNPSRVFVFCSEGKGTQEPKGETKEYHYYKPYGESQSIKIPKDIHVLHPSPKIGSAFIVKSIIFPTNNQGQTTIQWLHKEKGWIGDKIPTRGEYLIKVGKGRNLGKYRAILELEYPYIAEVTA